MEHLNPVTQRSCDSHGEKPRALLFYQQVSLASTTSTLSFARETQSNTTEVMTTSEWSCEEPFSGDLPEKFQLHSAQSCTTSHEGEKKEGGLPVLITTSPRLSGERKMTAYPEPTTYHLIRGHASGISHDRITKESSMHLSEKQEASLTKKVIGQDTPEGLFFLDPSQHQHFKSCFTLSPNPSQTSPRADVPNTTNPVALQWENAKRLAFQHQEPPPRPCASSPSQPYKTSARPLTPLEPFQQPDELSAKDIYNTSNAQSIPGEHPPPPSSRGCTYETSWIPRAENATTSRTKHEHSGQFYDLYNQHAEEKPFPLYEKEVIIDEPQAKQETQLSWIPMVHSQHMAHHHQNVSLPPEVQPSCPVLPLVDTSTEFSKGPYPLPEIIPCILPYFTTDAFREPFDEDRPTQALLDSTMIKGDNMTPFYVPPQEHCVTSFQSTHQAEQSLMDTELYFPDSETAGAMLCHSSTAFYATTQTISSQHLMFHSLSYEHSSPPSCFPLNFAEPHQSHDMCPTLILPPSSLNDDPVQPNSLQYVARRTPRIIKRYTKRQPSSQTNSPYKESFLKRCFLSLLSSKEEKSKESLV